ncbi:MAG: hypothetical protein ACR2FY_04275 [Pirellulaceae bacterium]
MSARGATNFGLNSLFVVVALFVTMSALAADPPSQPETLRYRRIYVPVDELNSQARGMIPLKREEFERRIAAWTARQPNSLAAQVRVERAVYAARLAGDQFIDGNARLDVVSAAREPVLLTWESTLAIGKPLWNEQPPRPARMGTTPAGTTALLVEKSGQLTVPWTLRGAVSEAQETSFNLHLPKAAITRLVLQLPAGLILETTAGIVARLEPGAVENRLLPTSVGALSTNWLVELGGLTQVQLRVKSAERAAKTGGIMLVRESATHILSPVDVSSEFGLQLDVHQAALKAIKLEVDADAKIIGIRQGAAPLSWREVAAITPQQTALQVDLPESLTGTGNGLTVSVVSPLALDRPWRLPRLRLLGGSWQEGTASLVVPPSLHVSSIQFTDARQTSISPGSIAQPQRTYQFQYLSPLGQVAVQSSRENPQLDVLGGLVVRHETTQLSAVLNIDLSVNTGQRFIAEGIIHEEWTVDSVDTSPPDLLEERQFIPIDGRKFALRVRLARPLTPQDKTRLVIRAHRPLPAVGESITAPALRLVDFQDERDEQLVVALRATDSSREFQLSGDLDLLRIDPESAAPEELSLLDSSATGLLFRLHRQGEGSRVSLVPSDPRFTVGIESSAHAQRGKIEHHAVARITPTSSSLTRLIVRSSGPVPAAMKWKLVGAGDLSIASQTLLPAQSPPTPEGQKVSVWELILSRVTTEPLTLESTWETSFSQGEVLPLFSFPEAAAQDGLVRIEAGQGVSLQIETEGAKPVPAPLAPAGSYSPIRGLFRYEPGRQATVGLRTPTKEDALPVAWANKCTLKSRFSLDGAAIHEITWRLENHGLDRFPFSLPAGVRPVQLSIDGEGAAIPVLDTKAQQHFIPLPEQRRHPVVSLTVATRAPETSGFLEHYWSAPLVTTPLRVLDRHWLVTLPPGIQQVAGGTTANVTNANHWYEIWKSRLWEVFSLLSAGDNAEFESPWSETKPLVVVIYSPGLVRTLGIALAIAAASVVIWLIPRRLMAVLIFAVLFSGAALLLPAAWSPLAAGVFWGALVGGLFGLARPFAESRPVVTRPSLPSTRTRIAKGLTASILFVVMTASDQAPATAAPDEPSHKAAVAQLHRVVIPVDADQKPLGDYVYVSLDFYALLYQAPMREQLPPWLLRSATYEMQVSEEGAAASVVMRLELETLVAQAKVSLPLRRGEVHLLEGRATLEGEPFSLDWNDTGTALRLEIERPGQYQLALAFSAAAKPENGTAKWDFSIPKTPRSALRIKSPLRPADWLMPGALGAVAKALDSDDLLIELGPTASFNVSRKDQRRPADNATEAEQLVWWKLRPGSVTADVLVRVRPVTGKINEVKLLADSRLRLLPLENETRVSRVWVEEGEFNTIHWTLAEPAVEAVELRGKFLLLDASGIGKLVLPRLEVLTDRKTKQWQAISVGKESDVSPDPETVIASIPPVEFVDSFGVAAGPPDLAFDASGQPQAFLIRPHEAMVRARESIDISIGRRDAEIVYRADLAGIPPHRFQEAIELPPGFRVKQAVLLEQEAVVSLRWPVAQQGSLTIHRGQSPANTQQLLIEGTLPMKALSGNADLVRLPSLRSAASDGATIRIYRTPATLALIKTATGIPPSAAPEGPPWDARLGHLLASYKSSPSPQPVVREFAVVRKANNPAATYRLVTKMERTTARLWSAVVKCEVTLESGSLDAARFEVPAEWSGPFELIPAMDHQVVLLPGQTQRHLVIRPLAGHLGKLSFSLRGPLKLQTGETPHAPVLLPLDAVRSDSFLLLPSRVADENLQWQTSGLQAMAALESQDAQLAAPGHEVFRVVAPRFAATLLHSKDSRGSTRIVFADLMVRPLLVGSYWAKANYYLLPGGRDEAELQLPAGSQLVQVLVNDSPAEIRNLPEGTWKVRLGHEQLPQQVTVIYEHHRNDSANGDPQAIPPVWLGIATDKTTWSLLSDKTDQQPTPSQRDSARDAVDPRSAALSQMAAVIRLVRDAGDTSVSGLPPAQLAAWLSLWRLEFARVNKAAALVAAPEGEDLLPSPMDRPETQRRALEAEFAATLSRYSDVPNVATPPGVNSGAELLPDGRLQSQASLAGDAVPLPLSVTPSSSDFAHRLGLALIVLTLGLAAAFVTKTTQLRESFVSSPAFALATLAAVCLILLPAGLIAAPLLAAAAAWFALRRSWPAAKADTGSRVLRPTTLSQ